MRKSILYILFLFSSSGLLNAQNRNSVNYDLAREFFYGTKEYQKAVDLLEEEYKRNSSAPVYSLLLNSYLALEQPEKALELARKQMKRFPDECEYTVDYGSLLIKTGEEKKGWAVYKTAIKDLPPIAKEVIDLSHCFQSHKEVDYAIEALLHGKKILHGNYGFEFELGEAYYQKGDISAMVEEYLTLIDKNEAYLQNVQNALNTSIYHDLNKAHIQTLNQALLRRVQRYPDQTIYSELLLWHNLQQKDFAGAIIQAKALDRRNNENGRRFITLGQACRSNREFDLAMQCYQYLIDQGPSSMQYINGRILMTETIREKITSSRYTREDLLTLEQNYIKTLDDLGRNAPTISLQIGLAEVWSQYLYKSEEAAKLLEEALKLPIAKANLVARCKLVLGDIYLGMGEIWEASLLYSQVEKDFKYDALGDEAKFKNARISFFTGDFMWAEAQLDVLKGSTSKLIANDALRLSLVISDNTVEDTVGEAVKMYARAALMVEQNKLELALSILDSMKRIYVVHSIMDEVLFQSYKVYFKQQAFDQCVEPLENIIKQFPQDVLADEAVFRLAELYDYQLANAEKAQELYKKLMTEYPSSVRTVAARNRYREMRGDTIN